MTKNVACRMAHPLMLLPFLDEIFYHLSIMLSTSSSILSIPPCCGFFSIYVDEDELLFQNTLDLQGDCFCIHGAVQVAFSNEFVRIFILKFPHNHRHTTAKEHTHDVAFFRDLRCRANLAFLCNEEFSDLRSLLKGLADLV
jgi:hypothetical protein